MIPQRSGLISEKASGGNFQKMMQERARRKMKKKKSSFGVVHLCSGVSLAVNVPSWWWGSVLLFGPFTHWQNCIWRIRPDFRQGVGLHCSYSAVATKVLALKNDVNNIFLKYFMIPELCGDLDYTRRAEWSNFMFFCLTYQNKSPSTLVTWKNAATLICCEAPEMFCGIQNALRLSISKGVSG